MAKGQERAVYYRAVKFQIGPTKEQENILLALSKNLGVCWNDALIERVHAFDCLREQKVLTFNSMQVAIAQVCGIVHSPTAAKMPTLFDQINALTKKRANEVDFDFSPRNWQEETLDRLDGSFKSFFKLAKNGDKDARPPRYQSGSYFQVIPGRSSFSVDEGVVKFATQTFKGQLTFDIPSYQASKLAEGKVKKFTLSRVPADLSKEGDYFVSIVYEVGLVPVAGNKISDAVYLSLGASSVGVLTSHHQEVLPFWRPDKHWKPLIESVKSRMNAKTLTKGSKKHTRLLQAYRDLNLRMARQQKQNHREMVKKLLSLGKHFVVTDYVVRSKKGKLADAAQGDRSGSHGLNWAAQNTGSFLDFLMHLEEKVKEVGGSVTKHQLTGKAPPNIGIGHHNKIAMARRLQEQYLASIG